MRLACAFGIRYRDGCATMSNVKKDRHVEHDWWQEPIPPNVEFGDGFYCESAQIFRKLRSKKPRAVVIGKHVSCYAGCSFAIGENGRCKVGRSEERRVGKE